MKRYYDAIAAHDYPPAWRMWDGDGSASGKTLEAFTEGFADTVSSRVTTGRAGEPEGAAGSIYVTVPVTVEAMLRDGTQQRFTGDYVLRRANAGTGVSPSERRWRIHSATLRPGG